jgi:hypothetical protein
MTDSADRKHPVPAATAVSPDAVIPRSALERVLARATELQSTGADVTEVVSEARLMEIAREVGIDTAHLRQALAEERSRLPMKEHDQGFVLDRLGPAALSAQRTVPGTPGEIVAKLENWMPRMESLALRRRIGDRISWEPKHDPLGNFFRTLGMGGRKLPLLRLDQITVSVNAVDNTRSVVRFDAEAFAARRTQRTNVAVMWTLAGIIGVGAGIPLAILGTGPAVGVGLLGLGSFAAGIGFIAWRAIRRAYRDMLDNVHLRCEQLLDELESGGMQPSPSLARQVTAALLR